MAGDGMVTAGRRPIILGHRGASAEAPENTLAAFRLAVEQGADGVELDVWRCRSGEVVVHHDVDTARVAGVAHRLGSTRWAELRRLDVGSWKGQRFAGAPRPGSAWSSREPSTRRRSWRRRRRWRAGAGAGSR